MSDLILWDAVIAWRDFILKSEFFTRKKTDSLSNLNKIIELGIIELNQPISNFIELGFKNSVEKVCEFTTWAASTRRSRIALLKSLCSLAKDGNIEKTDIQIPFINSRKAQKNIISEILSSNPDKSRLLNKSEIVSFTRELCKINPRDSLICWMMWEFQCSLHEILSLTINDIDLSKDILKDKNNEFLGEIREDLRPCIEAQIKDKNSTAFLFSTREGKTIHASQIVRNMKIASKRAELPFIYSPKILYADAKAYARRTFLSLPEEERTRLCLKMVIRD